MAPLLARKSRIFRSRDGATLGTEAIPYRSLRPCQLGGAGLENWIGILSGGELLRIGHASWDLALLTRISFRRR